MGLKELEVEENVKNCKRLIFIYRIDGSLNRDRDPLMKIERSLLEISTSMMKILMMNPKPS